MVLHLHSLDIIKMNEKRISLSLKALGLAKCRLSGRKNRAYARGRLILNILIENAGRGSLFPDRLVFYCGFLRCHVQSIFWHYFPLFPLGSEVSGNSPPDGLLHTGGDGRIASVADAGHPAHE